MREALESRLADTEKSRAEIRASLNDPQIRKDEKLYGVGLAAMHTLDGHIGGLKFALGLLDK